MSDLRLILQCLKGEATYHGQVDSDVFKKIQPDLNQPERDETEDDLTGDNLKQYEADIKAMNLILIFIPNDIYNSVDSRQTAKEMNIRDDPFDELFDYLQQYEKLVNASRAKKLEKSHDPLAVVAHTSSSSSRSPQPYYVTHPPSVVDYDDDYQGDTFQNDPEDPLTSAKMLLARAITQRYSTPTNNRLCSSSNTRNQVFVQVDRVNIQRRNVGNDGRIPRRSYNIQEESTEGSDVQRIKNNAKTPSSVGLAPRGCYVSKWVPLTDVATTSAMMWQWAHMPSGTTQVVTRGATNHWLQVQVAAWQDLSQSLVRQSRVSKA
ncbi:hypothetical protein Tco_0503521 [Tanacetum coccineum]